MQLLLPPPKKLLPQPELQPQPQLLLFLAQLLPQPQPQPFVKSLIRTSKFDDYTIRYAV